MTSGHKPAVYDGRTGEKCSTVTVTVGATFTCSN